MELVTGFKILSFPFVVDARVGPGGCKWCWDGSDDEVNKAEEGSNKGAMRLGQTSTA